MGYDFTAPGSHFLRKSCNSDLHTDGNLNILNFTHFTVLSVPTIRYEDRRRSNEKGVINGFIMTSPVLQLLMTTEKYCTNRYCSTRLSDRESCPQIRGSRGGRIPA